MADTPAPTPPQPDPGITRTPEPRPNPAPAPRPKLTPAQLDAIEAHVIAAFEAEGLDPAEAQLIGKIMRVLDSR